MGLADWEVPWPGAGHASCGYECTSGQGRVFNQLVKKEHSMRNWASLWGYRDEQHIVAFDSGYPNRLIGADHGNKGNPSVENIL